MDFRTVINIEKFPFHISHSDKILFIGSCFSQNISNKMKNLKFDIISNPTGILFNPASIIKSLEYIVKKHTFTEKDLSKNKDLWFSYNHHSEFSSTNKDECLENINSQIVKSYDLLKSCSCLIITFGTSKVYKLKENNQVVANCHKRPSDKFEMELLTSSKIIEDYNFLIKELKLFNPDIKIIFTVSPVRHIKDGIHTNQLSKASLLLAIDEIINLNDDCFYFPSFEILLDDLRDYRFYNDDLVHPNDFAINYIFDKFSESFFSSETKRLNKSILDLNNMLNHRPFNTNTSEYKIFLQKINEKIVSINKMHAKLNLNKEREIVKNKLKLLDNKS